MSLSIFLSMLIFAFVLSISPGPVNLMIISSGINHGFKKTFAFISGATIGFSILLAIIALGVNFIDTQSLFMQILEIIGLCFIVYMGYKIMSSSFNLQENKKSKTLKFYEGFLLQWLNPKAYMACISGVAIYNENTYVLSIFVILYFFVCYLCLSFWGVIGNKLRVIFNTQKKVKFLNLFMGVILIISAFIMLVRKTQSFF